MYTGNSQIVIGRSTEVRLDRRTLEQAADEDCKTSLALKAWHVAQHRSAAKPFLDNMRRIFRPDPAHMLDTSSPCMAAWRFTDFIPHDFVMDGQQHTDTLIGAIREHPVKYAAEQTYGVVVREQQPACFLVEMNNARLYRRLMLPFFDADHANSNQPAGRRHLRLAAPMRVVCVVTLITPIWKRQTLAEVIAEADGLDLARPALVAAD